MTPALLTAIRKHLYGSRWKPDLARAIKLTNPEENGTRRIRQWLSGSATIPEGVEVEIWRLMEEHGRDHVCLMARRPSNTF